MSFPITCTACHKTFTISDEIYEKKVAGRVVTIKCKSCSQGIRIDGTKKASEPAPAGSAVAAAAETPVASPPVAAAPTEPLWAVDYPDGQDREFTTSEVVMELQRGIISGATLVWRDGMGEWLEAAQVAEFSGEVAKLEAKKREAEQLEAKKREADRVEAEKLATKKREADRVEAEKLEANRKKAAAFASVKQSATATPIHTPRPPMPTETGLAGLPGAERKKLATTEPAVPRAKAPSASDLGKPRAQQPSASELNKPRAKLPSTSELGKPRAPQPSSPVLVKPQPPATATPLPSLPAAAPPPPPPMAPPPMLTPPAASSAPAAATPFPLTSAVSTPPPFVARPQLLTPPLPFGTPPPPTMDVTPPLPASVAKVVSAPLQTKPAFPAAASSNAPAFGAVPTIASAHASVEWPEAKSKAPLIIVGLLTAAALIGGAIFLLGGKDELPPPTPITAVPAGPTPTSAKASLTSPPPGTAQPAAETASGSDPVAGPRDPGATPGAGFAELFAAGARKAEAKGATSAPTARFDAAATKTPLAQAANEAQACKQNGGPTGKVAIVVTFDPSGKVASATITDPPFAGTDTAVCISSAFKHVSIAPFSGLPGTVSKSFSLL